MTFPKPGISSAQAVVMIYRRKRLSGLRQFDHIREFLHIQTAPFHTVAVFFERGCLLKPIRYSSVSRIISDTDA